MKVGDKLRVTEEGVSSDTSLALCTRAGAVLDVVEYHHMDQRYLACDSDTHERFLLFPDDIERGYLEEVAD